MNDKQRGAFFWSGAILIVASLIALFYTSLHYIISIVGGALGTTFVLISADHTSGWYDLLFFASIIVVFFAAASHIYDILHSTSSVTVGVIGLVGIYISIAKYAEDYKQSRFYREQTFEFSEISEIDWEKDIALTDESHHVQITQLQ